MEFNSKLYDYVRIDHFIGIVRYYKIPYGAKNGMVGEFADGPGMNLIEAINSVSGECQIIAEDLGLVTDEVRDLIKKNWLSWNENTTVCFWMVTRK